MKVKNSVFIYFSVEPLFILCYAQGLRSIPPAGQVLYHSLGCSFHNKRHEPGCLTAVFLILGDPLFLFPSTQHVFFCDTACIFSQYLLTHYHFLFVNSTMMSSVCACFLTFMIFCEDFPAFWSIQHPALTHCLVADLVLCHFPGHLLYYFCPMHS